jgi:hypothetical protein
VRYPGPSYKRSGGMRMEKQRPLLFCYLLNTTSFSFSFMFVHHSALVLWREKYSCCFTRQGCLLCYWDSASLLKCVESAVTDTPLHHSSAPTVTSKTCNVNHGELQSFVCQLRQCHSPASTSRPSGHSRCYGRTARGVQCITKSVCSQHIWATIHFWTNSD